jgi:hypothetical protein
MSTCRDQVAQRRAGAGVRDVGDEGLGLQLEQLAGQVVRGAGAGRAVVELARAALHQLEEGLEVGPDVLRVDHHHLRHAGHQRERDQVLLEVVVELGVHRRRDGVVHRAHEDVVAVGRRARRDAGAQRAAGAAAVVDDQLLAGLLGELRRQRPGEGVGAAAGRERHDHHHRLGRPAAALREGQRARRR